jgi:flagellar basal body-associated protein FliL
MDTPDSSINIATILLILIGGLVVLSLLTLAVYFFGGSSPLERNALGRVEAAQKPEEVLKAQRQYSSLRLIFTLVVVLGFYLFLRGTAPEQTDQAISAFVEAVSIALNKVQMAMRTLLQG